MNDYRFRKEFDAFSFAATARELDRVKSESSTSTKRMIGETAVIRFTNDDPDCIDHELPDASSIG